VSYQFSWARNPRWSQYYSGAREIWNYLCDIVDKYQLRKYIKLKHTVISANWNEDEGKWHVLVKDGDGAL
jgi:cation diffusion facilitator CzcD-associated flavoprotein CzcO